MYFLFFGATWMASLLRLDEKKSRNFDEKAIKNSGKLGYLKFFQTQISNQIFTNQVPSRDRNDLENVVKILVDGLIPGTLVEMTLFMLIFVAIGSVILFHMGDIYKVWENDGQIFATHYLSNSRNVT